MKQIIIEILENLSYTGLSIDRKEGREEIANILVKKIWGSMDIKPPSRNDKSKLKEQEIEDSWICNICGKSTFDVDYDYLGSGTNHLGCELKPKWVLPEDGNAKENNAK